MAEAADLALAITGDPPARDRAERHALVHNEPGRPPPERRSRAAIFAAAIAACAFPIMYAVPRAPRIPCARRRSRRRTPGGGRRNGRRHRAARSALWPPDSTGLGHPEVIASAQLHRTGVQAARRRPGEVAARTDRLRTNNGRGRLRCRRNWPPASGCARGAPRAARRCSSAASRPAAAGAAIRRGAWAHGLKTPGSGVPRDRAPRRRGGVQRCDNLQAPPKVRCLC